MFSFVPFGVGFISHLLSCCFACLLTCLSLFIQPVWVLKCPEAHMVTHLLHMIVSLLNQLELSCLQCNSNKCIFNSPHPSLTCKHWILLVLNPFQICYGVFQVEFQQVSQQWDGWGTRREVFGPVGLKVEPQGQSCSQKEDQGDHHAVAAVTNFCCHLLIQPLHSHVVKKSSYQ